MAGLSVSVELCRVTRQLDCIFHRIILVGRSKCSMIELAVQFAQILNVYRIIVNPASISYGIKILM